MPWWNTMPRANAAEPADLALSEMEKAFAAAVASTKGGRSAGAMLDRLRKAGYEVRRTVAPAEDETPHIYDGFPFRFGEGYAYALRSLSDMLMVGEAEIDSMSIVFSYYRKADNEDGYELRKGLVRSTPEGG